MSTRDPLVRLRATMLKRLATWGYGLWTWADDKLAGPQIRCVDCEQMRPAEWEECFVHEGHVRARTLPDDPALDDLRTEWGEVEYVPASQLRGAVDDRDRYRAALERIERGSLTRGPTAPQIARSALHPAGGR